jgi:signal transduction histidine kinase
LILDVLKLERLKAAARDPNNLEHVNIDAVVRKCIDKLKPIASSRQIAINGSAEHFVVEGIPYQLEVLFENIISNAISYSYDRASVEIGSAIDRHSSSAVVTIVDHGIGIGDKDLPHIFDEYFYAPRAAAHNRKSSGIGLSIVKTVAENNKLQIKVDSEPNRGTTFHIIFSGVIGERDAEKNYDRPERRVIQRQGACEST